jgi:predicted dehydrogenase
MAGRGDPVSIGIIGCGEVAEHKHLRVLRDAGEARVVALADADSARLNRVADRYGIAHRYQQAGALLDHPGLEVVGVCVPAFAHAAVAVPAIEAGKHVYLEKPLALSPEDAGRVLQAARGRPGKYLLGFHMRWHRLIREARRRLAAGAVGRIESIRTLWFSPRTDESLPAWRLRRGTGGGALMEIGVHAFDLWRHLTGAEVEQVFATANDGSRDDEAAAVMARLSNGALAVGLFSERTSHEIEVEICGDQGRLRIGCQRFDGMEYFPAGSAPGQTALRLRNICRFFRELPAGLPGMRAGGDYLGSYRAVWRHFCRIVRTGDAPECTLEDGRRALEIALAAATSSDTGMPVRLERQSVTGACPERPAGAAGS